MKLAFGSDLHLEFGPVEDSIFNIEADVLVLAGDIVVSGQAKRKDPKVVDFFKKAADSFENVIYIMGNHEHYHGNLSKTESILRDMLPQGITFLENKAVTINDIKFLAATLWTDFNKDDWFSKDMARRSMSDYSVIKVKIGNNYMRLRPEHTLMTHRKSVAWLEKEITPGSVVITHHLPSYLSVPEAFKHLSQVSNGAYASSLEYLMDSKEPKLWIHGHIHTSCDYTAYSTRVMCNPRGYCGYDDTAGYKFKVIEI